MEDSLNKKYVNISDKPFRPSVYNVEEKDMFSYKPSSGLWLSLETDEEGYYSEWDKEYRETIKTDCNGNLHATTVKFKPTTYIMSPDADKTILEGFSKFVSTKQLSPEQKRKLLVELVRTHTDRKDVENVICQIDLLADISALEEIFANYKLGNSYPDEFYKTLATNVKKGIRESFSGLEVTAYALGLDESSYDECISDVQAFYWPTIDPKYSQTIEYFEIPSAVIFDTSCLDIEKEVVYSPKTKLQEGEDR